MGYELAPMSTMDFKITTPVKDQPQQEIRAVVQKKEDEIHLKLSTAMARMSSQSLGSTSIISPGILDFKKTDLK